MVRQHEADLAQHFNRSYSLPVDAITRVSDGSIHVSKTREHIAVSPAYDPELVPPLTCDYWEPFYGYYGLSPYWGFGYAYPNFPFSTEQMPRRV